MRNVITEAARLATVTRIMPGAPHYVTHTADAVGLYTDTEFTQEAAIEAVAFLIRRGKLDTYRGTLFCDASGGTWLDFTADARELIAREDAEEAHVDELCARVVASNVIAMPTRPRQTLAAMSSGGGDAA